MNIKKMLWFSLGCILLAVAFVGVYLPGLPWSTPAVGAAYCFATVSYTHLTLPTNREV